MSSWTQEWDDDQRAFIEKLGKMENAFRDIFAKDKDGMVIGYEERHELENLQRKNHKILTKLTKQEFTVAVVGLEKAGKSTLGNALIKKNMLPEYTERCTYTTTEIRAGSEDFAEVHFYSMAEFQANFQKMLQAVKYEHEADFLALDRVSFDRFWAAMEDKDNNTYQAHNGTTVEDIRAILDGKNTIRQLLGQQPRRFTVAETEEMQVYITGIGKRHQEGYVERTVHPYAVKNVIIQSTELQDMEHVVLYDVPGFDSPTQLHKEQTEKMLKEADAIVLVTNVGDRPNLTGTQLDMLRKGRDEDDVKLSAKAFVFGNKIDIARNRQVARDNEAALRNDAVNKYAIATGQRVMVGSAKAYLDRNGISSRDARATDTESQNKLQEWGMDDGIDVLKNRMMDYYTHDRFEVLKQRAEKTLERTEIFLREILDKYSPEALGRIDNAGDQYVVEATFALQSFVREANKILINHHGNIEENRPFSSLIETNIEEIFPLMEEDSKQLKDIELQGAIYSATNYPATRVDAELRERLKTEFLRNVVEIAASRTREEQQHIRQELVDSLLHVLGMQENSPYKDELVQGVHELFDALLVENGEECRFNSLVERFTGSFIQAVITCPFGQDERYRHVSNPREIPEFISLAAYYRKDGESPSYGNNEMQQRLFAQILAHEELDGLDDNNPGNVGVLTQFFREHRDLVDQGANLAIDLLPLAKWGKMLMKAGIALNNQNSLSKWDSMLRDANFQRQWKGRKSEDKIKYLNDLVQTLCDKHRASSKESDHGMEEDMNLSQLLQTLSDIGHDRSIKSKEDMLKTLNTDIAIMRDIMLHAIIWAIDLERAYSSVIEKNVELIRTGVMENQQLIGEWLSQNVRKIRESEFAAIVNEQAINQARRMIVESIREVLKEVEQL